MAIIFPKHGFAPINGADPDAGSADAGPVHVEAAKLLRGDVYEVLRRRQAQARADGKARSCSCERPAAEQLGIPPDVLAGSPELRALLDEAQPAAGADDNCCDDTP